MNFPKAFIEQIKNNLGDEADALLESLSQQEEIVSVRINKEKNNSQNKLNKVPWCDTSYYFPQRPSFTLDPLFHAGAYYVQEASSMFLEQIVLQLHLDNKNCRVLDLCAAPGGKSTHLISLLSDESLLIANEVIRTRTSVLAENISKWGKPNYIVTANDAKDFTTLENYFDAIVCDAPCSGEGMFRKDAHAISEWSTDNVLHCAQRQKRIVADVWSSLKPGGYFIYSTCTFNKNENEENVKWICETLGAKSVRLNLKTDFGVTETIEKAMVGDDANHGQKIPPLLWTGAGGEVREIFGYHFYPHKLKGEGFFISVIQKNDEEGFSEKKFSKNYQKHNKGLEKLSVKDSTPFNHLITASEKFIFLNENNHITIFPEIFEDDLLLLKSNLRIISFGVEIAELKGKDILPQQALANSLFLNENAFEKTNLNLVDSLRYLKGETNFNFDCENGWLMMCYFHPAMQKSFPLGFAKKVGGRINNQYPKNRMIRMLIDYEKIKASGEEAFVYPFVL